MVWPWEDEIADPWIALTAIVLRTERIKLGPMVTPLPRRRPWKLARETVTLDHLSGGRLILGVGIGDFAQEFANLGEAAEHSVRAAMLDEGLEVLTRLWSGEQFSHHGTFYHLDDARFEPTPLQQPRIPIWIGGSWPNKAPFRRAARWDGAFPQRPDLNFHEQLAPEAMAAVHDFVQSQRTSDAPFDLVHFGITPGRDRDADRATVAAYADVGVTWWVEHIVPTRWRSWEGPWPLIPGAGDGWPLDEMRARILAGPPR